MGWIGVDFDGTLAHDSAPLGAAGAPIMPMVELVKQWLAQGRDVRIFTARVGDNRRSEMFLMEQRRIIEAFCTVHFGRVLPITATKNFDMEVLYDDRAVGVQRNVGHLLSLP